MRTTMPITAHHRLDIPRRTMATMSAALHPRQLRPRAASSPPSSRPRSRRRTRAGQGPCPFPPFRPWNAGRARSPEGAGRRPSVLILVATANPPSRGGVALIAAIRYEIHVVIGDVQHVELTLIGRVRVVDLAAVLQEHADAGGLSQPPRAELVVVVELPGLHLLLGERDAIVHVEVAAER